MIRSFLKNKLLHSYGLPAKLGQIFSQGSVSADPEASITHQEAQAILARHGLNAEIDETIFTASMGQVFKTKIYNTTYAVKILHPGIREKIQKEIEQALVMGSLFAKTKNFQFDKDVFRRFLNETFSEETDLIREARFQNNFREKLPHVLIPEVIKVNEEILVQEFVESTLARDMDHIPDFAVIEFFFEALLKHGLLHGDLNDRNWGYQNGKLVVYDFGCSQIISERRRNGLIKLLLNQDLPNAFKEFGIRLEATSYKGKEQELRDSMFLPPYHMDKSLREYCDPWILLLLRSLYSIKMACKNQEIPFEKILKPFLQLKVKAPHSDIRIEVTENLKQIVSLTLPIAEINNLPFLIPNHVLEKIEAQGLDVKDLLEKKEGIVLGNRSYKIWTE